MVVAGLLTFPEEDPPCSLAALSLNYDNAGSPPIHLYRKPTDEGKMMSKGGRDPCRAGAGNLFPPFLLDLHSI